MNRSAPSLFTIASDLSLVQNAMNGYLSGSASQLNIVSFSGATALANVSNISLAGPAAVDESNPFTLTLTDNNSNISPGESASLIDAATGATIATATFVSNGAGKNPTATFTVPPDTSAVENQTVYAVYGGDGTVSGSNSNTLTLAVHYGFAQAVINGNQTASPAGLLGVQRSVVDNIVYTFPAPVNIPADSGAFTIAVDTDSGVIANTTPTSPPNLIWTAVSPASDGSSAQWVVTFDHDGPDVDGDSIEDGVYKITAHGSAITWATGSNAGSPVAPGGMQVDTFYRLFGDLLGQGMVGGADLNLAIGLGGVSPSSPRYNAALDSTGEYAPIPDDIYDELLGIEGAIDTGFTVTGNSKGSGVFE